MSTSPPWMIVSSATPEDKLRRYRLYLTGYLASSPKFDVMLDPRRVANFWIIASLLNTVKNVPDLEVKRDKILTQIHIMQQAPTETVDIQRILSFQTDIPNIQQSLVVSTYIQYLTEPHKYTPEMSDQTFKSFLDQIPKKFINSYLLRTCDGPRPFRLAVIISHDITNYKEYPPMFAYIQTKKTYASIEDKFADLFMYDN